MPQPANGPNLSEAIVIPVFRRYLRMPCRIPLSTLLVLLAVVVIFAKPPGIQAQVGLSGVATHPSDSAHKPRLLLPADYPVKFIATGFNAIGIAPVTRNIAGIADLDQDQTRQPAAPAAPPAPGSLTWHGITLYGAYDIGVGWVSHGLPENGYNYEG